MLDWTCWEYEKRTLEEFVIDAHTPASFRYLMEAEKRDLNASYCWVDAGEQGEAGTGDRG